MTSLKSFSGNNNVNSLLGNSEQLGLYVVGIVIFAATRLLTNSIHKGILQDGYHGRNLNEVLPYTAK